MNNQNIWSVDFGNFWCCHLHFKWASTETAAIHMCLSPAQLTVFKHYVAHFFASETQRVKVKWRLCEASSCGKAAMESCFSTAALWKLL